MNTSKYHLYSRGIVAKDVDPKTGIIEVTPIEVLQFFDGDIAHKEGDNIEIHEGVDSYGNKYTTREKSNNSIQAKWKPMTGSNRETPPDVVLGERVTVYQFADENTFYWDIQGEDNGYRQLEEAIWYFANKQDRKKKTNNETNAYQIIFSTRNKLIRIKTNKSDGERYAYEISLDTKKGYFNIKDDVGNQIILDSPKTHIKLVNKDSSFLELLGKVINVSSSDSINLKTNKYTLNCTTATVKATTGNYNINTWTADGGKLTVSHSTLFTGGSVRHGANNIGKDHKHTVGTPFTSPPLP